MYRENKNFGFGDLAIGNKGKNDFLTSVNTLLDWDSIEKILKSSLKRGFNAIGQPPYSELLLFKILLLQTWFNLSDTKVEEAINDRISFIKFLNLSEDRKEEDTQDSISETKIITSYSDDKEARWIKKYGRYLYGYKIHNSVNKEGYILGGVVTGANESDTRHLESILNEIMLEEGLPVLADKGYTSARNSEILESKNLVDKIMLKATKSKKLTAEENAYNREISKFRYVVEQTFGLLKLHFGYTRCRYISQRKVELEYMLKSLSFNTRIV